jgi:hypothetical protein
VPHDLHIEPLGEQVHEVAAHAVAIKDSDRATVHSRMHATCSAECRQGDRVLMTRRRGMKMDGFEEKEEEEEMEEEQEEDKKRRRRRRRALAL